MAHPLAFQPSKPSKVQKVVDVPQIEIKEQVVDVPVQKQVHIPFQQARGTCAKAPKPYKHHRSLILESCIWQKVLNVRF